MEHAEIYENPKNHHLKVIVFLVFAIVLALLIVPSFYNDFSFTGFTISNITANSSIKITADLTIPALKVNGNFENVEINSNSGDLYVEDEKFRLNPRANYIIFNSYAGEISFNDANISKIKGKAIEVSVNGVVVEPKTKKTLKVATEGNIHYTSLKIKNKVFIDKFSYISSGNINIGDGKSIFSLEDEKVDLKNFIGDLTIENGKIKLEGYVERLDIRGASGISITS